VPDGRVFIVGGEGQPGNEPDKSVVEAFRPPYLFRGPRPVMKNVGPLVVGRGAALTFTVERTSALTKVVLSSTLATTHFMDSGNGRMLELEFTQSGDAVTATVPADAARAMLGYYTLFGMVDDIPSEGVIVRVEKGTGGAGGQGGAAGSSAAGAAGSGGDGGAAAGEGGSSAGQGGSSAGTAGAGGAAAGGGAGGGAGGASAASGGAGAGASGGASGASALGGSAGIAGGTGPGGAGTGGKAGTAGSAGAQGGGKAGGSGGAKAGAPAASPSSDDDGGCGCAVPGASPSGTAWTSALVALAAAGLGRRRRRA
jgi:MYXO-CTERM domain-containing protein